VVAVPKTLEEILAEFDEHRALWSQTLHHGSDMHSDEACTAYRMAMEWVNDLLEPLR
jgi:hypothetical protein